MATLADNDFIEKRRTLRFMALGMANNQAKVEFFRQEHMPLTLAFLEDEELVGKLETALLLAGEIRKSLWSAVSWMSVLIVSPNSDGKNWKDINPITKDQAGQLYQHWSVESDFWGALEIPFLRLLEVLPNDPETATNEWKATLKQTAWKSLEKAADQAGENVHALKAAVRARSYLGHDLKDLFPEPEKEVSA